MSAHAVMSSAHRSRARTVNSGLSRTVNAVATLGSLVTLSALLVLAGAVGGLVDGAPTGHVTVTVTFDSAGH
ncbi:MAG: hypothetical protein J0I49_09180 [Pseudonocardia sp.]|uniref:hypothetical protein n=1 Tax=Pseudonocardia sp. TaxID=60912 RepID=UPI001AC7F537|nr:hypothetical protein [Pseudonocardia sp.]MBN9098266.1 hypothetical protein [Pseudonocardia sp.]